MTNYSTARVIMYDLRPSKQIERKLVFDTISIASQVAGGCRDLPFIGMGGTRFIDFIVANKLLGTKSFVSVEHDDGLIQRCEYNKPFNTVTVRNSSVHDFLLDGGVRRQAIVWLDYERGLSEDIRDELQLLTGTIMPGSFVFVTCKGVPERSLSGLSPKQVRDHYEDQLGKFALAFPVAEYGRKQFAFTAAKLLHAILLDGFKGRPDGSFSPYLRLTYSDSNPMVTVGGYFGDGATAASAGSIVAKEFGFLRSTNTDFVYDVGDFNLTEPERRLFNRAALAPFGPCKDGAQLRSLGFADSEIETYRDLMRYVPRYFEALL